MNVEGFTREGCSCFDDFLVASGLSTVKNSKGWMISHFCRSFHLKSFNVFLVVLARVQGNEKWPRSRDSRRCFLLLQFLKINSADSLVVKSNDFHTNSTHTNTITNGLEIQPITIKWRRAQQLPNKTQQNFKRFRILLNQTD